MDRQVKIDSRSIHLCIQVTQYTTAEPPRTAADPWWVRGGHVSGITGGSEKFSAGVSGLVKKTLYCTVVYHIDDQQRTRRGVQTSGLPSAPKETELSHLSKRSGHMIKGCT